MQLFLAVGNHVGTIALELLPFATVGSLREQLSQRIPAAVASEARLIFAGRQLRRREVLADAGLQHGSTIQVACRLRGGGGDGGSTGAESRSCYLEMYQGKKPDKVNPAEQQLARYTSCQLSGEPLSSPCVVDELGMLYNKDALIHALLNKTIPPTLSHISGLKSVVDLKLHPSSNKSRAPKQQGNTAVATNESQFCCPVTGLEFNGRFRFVVHRPTGLVLSERALKEVPAAAEDVLGGRWSDADLIVINPSGEELELIRERLSEKLALEREKKKAKKHKLKDENGTNGHVISNGGSGADGGAGATTAVHDGLERHLKKVKATDYMPAGATKEVFASLFDSSVKVVAKETYLCRNTGARGFRQA